MTELLNLDDYGFSFSEEADAKLDAVFGDSEADDLKAYAANVLIGNIPVQRVTNHVGLTFQLHGFHARNARFSDNRTGKYTILFGRMDGQPCAYATTSDKMYSAVMAIIAVYGTPAGWKNGVKVRIRMNQQNENKDYTLEVI